MTVATSTPTSTQELAERYKKAWVDEDLEAILALHTPDYTAFVLHGAEGVQRWEGTDACREVFDYLLRLAPDWSWETTSLVVRDDFYVAHHNLIGTLVMPWQMAGRTYQPIGRPISFEIVDIIHCENNLVRIKEGWVDGLAMHNQLSAG